LLKSAGARTDGWYRKGVVMPHMVIFRSAEGKPGYHQAETLDDAVRFVERLRNQEGVDDTRVFRMQEVPLEVKTYYKVEVAPLDALPVVEDIDHGAADEPVVVEPVPAGSGQAANRFNRFNRG
jgi:hypothetical protein